MLRSQLKRTKSATSVPLHPTTVRQTRSGLNLSPSVMSPASRCNRATRLDLMLNLGNALANQLKCAFLSPTEAAYTQIASADTGVWLQRHRFQYEHSNPLCEF